MARARFAWLAGIGVVGVLAFAGGRVSAPAATPVIATTKTSPAAATWRAALDDARRTPGANAMRDDALEILNTADGDVALGDAVRLLGWVGQPEDHDLLLSFASSREPALQEPGLEALGRLGTDESVATLTRLLDNRHTNRHAVLMALGASGHPEASALLERRLQDPRDAWVAAPALARFATPHAVQALASALRHSDAHRAGALAQALSALSDDVPEASDALYRVLMGPRTPVRAAALLALSEVHDPVVYDLLVADIRAQGPSSAHAVIALGRLGDPRAIPLLATEAREGRSDTRYSAIVALAQLDHSQADAALLELVRTAPAPVAAQAVNNLPRIDDDAIVDALLEASRDRPRQVRQAVLQRLLGEQWALGAAPPRVLELARDELVTSAWDSWGINPVGLLLQHGTPDDVLLVESALRDGPTNIRAAAVWSLESLEPERSRRLLDILAGDPDMNVRQSALSVMLQQGFYDLVEERLLADLEISTASYGGTDNLLMQLGTPRATAAVMARIETGTRREWSNAIQAVASSGTKDQVDQLLAIADRTESADLRQQILSSLIYTDTVDVDAVVDRALATDDPTLHATAAMALARSGTPASRDLLSELARSDNPQVANSALSSLAQVGGEDAEAIVIEALNNPDVAWTAVSSLRDMGTPTARAALIRAAEAAEDPQVRATALQELPNLGTDDAQRILTDALLDENTEVRYGATSALEGSGSTQAAQAIADALRSGSLSDEEAIPLAQALERMGGEVAEANASLLEDLLPQPIDTGIPVQPIDGF